MLFELSVARAEKILHGEADPEWEECLALAVRRQRQHFDAQIPSHLGECDRLLADWAARNLVEMLRSVLNQRPKSKLICNPAIPGLGWISSGAGDFSIGSTLIEVKHTDRNFVAGDFRQVLIYWLLKYSASLERDEAIWSECLLLNPRRNSALLVNFDYLLRSASPDLNRVQLYELLRSVVVGFDADRFQ